MTFFVYDCAKLGASRCKMCKALANKCRTGFATERLRRQEDYRNMEKTMTAKTEEGLRSEQLTRQEAQNEIKQMVRKDLDVLKEEMNNMRIGSGSTLCSEALEWDWEARVPSQGPQLLHPGTVKCSSQERWN